MNKKVLYITAFTAFFNIANGAEPLHSQSANSTLSTSYTSLLTEHDNVSADALSATHETIEKTLLQPSISQLAHEPKTTTNVPTPPNVILDLYDNAPLFQQEDIEQFEIQLPYHDMLNNTVPSWNIKPQANKDACEM